MSLLVASLYLLCIAFLFGAALFVFARNPYAQLNGSFALLSLCLLLWVASLFVFNAQPDGKALLWLGRLNFAAAALAAPVIYLFVSALAKKPLRFTLLVWTETAVLALASLFTGLIDRSEIVLSGQHITRYGALFPLYVLHLLFCIAFALHTAFHTPTPMTEQTRGQLRLVGLGILITAGIGITTNAALPYIFGDFHFIDVGTLSTIFFLAVVAYAAVFYHLFNIRIIVRTTLVFAVLITLALAFYQLSVEFLARLLPLGDPTSRHAAAATVALIINACTQAPVRHWLEHLADRLTTHRRPTKAARHGGHS